MFCYYTCIEQHDIDRIVHVVAVANLGSQHGNIPPGMAIDSKAKSELKINNVLIKLIIRFLLTIKLFN